MSTERNIVAIGGGGFGRITKDNKIEKYILSLSKKDKPNKYMFYSNSNW